MSPERALQILLERDYHPYAIPSDTVQLIVEATEIRAEELVAAGTYPPTWPPELLTEDAQS